MNDRQHGRIIMKWKNGVIFHLIYENMKKNNESMK